MSLAGPEASCLVLGDTGTTEASVTQPSLALKALWIKLSLYTKQ